MLSKKDLTWDTLGPFWRFVGVVSLTCERVHILGEVRGEPVVITSGITSKVYFLIPAPRLRVVFLIILNLQFVFIGRFWQGQTVSYCKYMD